MTCNILVWSSCLDWYLALECWPLLLYWFILSFSFLRLSDLLPNSRQSWFWLGLDILNGLFLSMMLYHLPYHAWSRLKSPVLFWEGLDVFNRLPFNSWDLAVRAPLTALNQLLNLLLLNDNVNVLQAPSFLGFSQPFNFFKFFCSQL